MASFRLQEAARRLSSLARETDSTALRRQLKTVAHEILSQEKQLGKLRASGSEPKARNAKPAPTWRGGRRPRSVA